MRYFERSTNKIVGIDTTLVDVRNIGFDFDTDSSSVLVFKFELEDNISQDVNAPNTSGNKPEFVVFDVLRNPDEMSFAEIEKNILSLGEKARNGKITIEDLQGGTFTKGNVKDNVMHDWNNTPTQQYVRSFFMDKTEVTNVMYLEYLDWLKKKYYGDQDTKKIYEAALPDTLAWRNPLGFNEDMVNNYLRHPAFQNHPVVGVSWDQASNYAKWRTNRANERILIDKGYLKDSDSIYYSDFNTKSYLFNPSNNESNVDSLELPNGRYASVETGLLLPEYRLPTETEWEYAALGSSKAESNNYRGKKKFPWEGEYTRSQKKKTLGDQLANYKLGQGDYGGIAGWSETGSGITTSVRSYPPNNFGLYGMAGNVAEWVADVYRPIIDDDANDFNYYRGNLYTKPLIDDNGKVTTITRENVSDQYEVLPNGRLLIK